MEPVEQRIMPMPSAKVYEWLVTHPDIFAQADYASGYNTDSGFAYDILLSRGHCEDGEHGHHTIIEPTAKEMLKKLRNVGKCECHDCVTGEGW